MTIRLITIGIASSLALACGSTVDDEAATTDATDSGVDSGVDSGGDDGPLTHGVIRIELRRGESQAANPYVGTAHVVATFTYRECLTDFYDQNPAMRQDGPDGEPIFGGADQGGEGWRDRLCMGDADLVDCTVESIVQQLDVTPQLTVTYAVSGELENRTLLFGPLPTKDTAGCLDPIVRVSTNGAVKGQGAASEALWVTESFSPTEAITNQGGAIVIRAAQVE